MPEKSTGTSEIFHNFLRIDDFEIKFRGRHLHVHDNCFQKNILKKSYIFENFPKKFKIFFNTFTNIFLKFSPKISEKFPKNFQ